MRLGIDIDGVVYQWDKRARELFKEQKGLDIPEPTSYWGFLEEYVGQDNWEWLWEEGHDLGLFSSGSPVPGALDSLRRLDKYHDLVYITSRPKRARAATLYWMGCWSVPADEIHILGPHEAKSQVECDVYLDDKGRNCHELIQNTSARVYCFDTPWNQHFTGPRVEGWEDFENILEGGTDEFE